MTEEYLRRLTLEITACPEFSGGVARQVQFWAVLRL